jgi:hypothetical protein
MPRLKTLRFARLCRDEFDLNKEDAVKGFDREIAKEERELSDLMEKRSYFEKQFGVYWNMKDTISA